MCAEACGEEPAYDELLGLVPGQPPTTWPEDMLRLLDGMNRLRMDFCQAQPASGTHSKAETKTYVTSHWKTVDPSEPADLCPPHS